MERDMDKPAGIITAVAEGPVNGLEQAITLTTQRGAMECRLYRAAAPTRRGAIWVGGIGGGWDTPARGLYPRLCAELTDQGIASLRVRFRNPRDLAEAVFDVRAGLSFLEERGIDRIALTGHSFGGAVVIQAAARSFAARTVVTLATQSYGAELAAQLGPGCSLLLIHGLADRVLPAGCSQYIHELARPPRRIILYPQAGHSLDEVADEVRQVVAAWIDAELRQEPAPTADQAPGPT